MTSRDKNKGVLHSGSIKPFLKVGMEKHNPHATNKNELPIKTAKVEEMNEKEPEDTNKAIIAMLTILTGEVKNINDKLNQVVNDAKNTDNKLNLVVNNARGVAEKLDGVAGDVKDVSKAIAAVSTEAKLFNVETNGNINTLKAELIGKIDKTDETINTLKAELLGKIDTTNESIKTAEANLRDTITTSVSKKSEIQMRWIVGIMVGIMASTFLYLHNAKDSSVARVNEIDSRLRDIEQAQPKTKGGSVPAVNPMTP